MQCGNLAMFVAVGGGYSFLLDGVSLKTIVPRRNPGVPLTLVTRVRIYGKPTFDQPPRMADVPIMLPPLHHADYQAGPYGMMLVMILTFIPDM